MQARLAVDPIRAQTVSAAWLAAVRLALDAPGHRLFHQVTQIEDPTAEDPAVRQAVDGLLADLSLPPVETVANTIFPSGIAATSKSYEQLTERYRRLYPTLKRWPANVHGTYFGRLVAYPAAGQHIDQLAELIRKLRTELRTSVPKAARYEVNLAAPGETFPTPSPAANGTAFDASEKDATVVAQPLPIHCPGQDTGAMAFPCGPLPQPVPGAACLRQLPWPWPPAPLRWRADRVAGGRTHGYRCLRSDRPQGPTAHLAHHDPVGPRYGSCNISRQAIRAVGSLIHGPP